MSDYFQIVPFFKALFPDSAFDDLQFSTRVCFEDKIAKFPNPDSNQDVPLIVIME